MKGKDLNLLLVFDALWKERNVTKAAKALGLTQPSLSRALGRLRAEFSDPLFVRVPGGVSPTDRAIELAKSIIVSIESLHEVYSPGSKFDLKTVQKVFTLVTSDYFEVIASTKLIPSVLKEAPGIILGL